MDTSFDQFAGGGWGDQNDDMMMGSQAQGGQRNTFEKVPVPVNVESLLAMGEDEEKYSMGEYSFTTVRLMGRISTVAADAPDYTTYELCDGLAPDMRIAKRFTMIHYRSVDTSAKGTYAVSQTVQAVGKLRLFNNRLSLIAFNIREVTMEELELFELECELARHYYENNLPEQAHDEEEEKETVFQSESENPNATGQHPQATATGGYGMMATPSRASASGTQMGSAMRQQQQQHRQQQVQAQQMSQQNQQSHGNQNMTMQQRRIVDCIKQFGVGEHGVHIDKIRAVVKPNTNFADDLHFLLSDGVVYTTTDEDHYSMI